MKTCGRKTQEWLAEEWLVILFPRIKRLEGHVKRERPVSHWNRDVWVTVGYKFRAQMRSVHRSRFGSC